MTVWAARTVVVGARWSRSGGGWRGLWPTWSELSGAAQDVVDVVRGRRELGGAARDVVDVVHG
jgi:hypothetical protein